MHVDLSFVLVSYQCVSSFQWLIGQYACASYKLVTVPLYDTLGDEALLYICNQGNLFFFFSFLNYIKVMLSHA